MNDEQFIAEVKNLVELDSDEAVRKAIGATLETLRERLAGEEPSDLAAQLPPEIAPYVEGDGGRERKLTSSLRYVTGRCGLRRDCGCPPNRCPGAAGLDLPFVALRHFTLLQNADASTEIWGARASFFHEIYLKK